MDRYHIYHPKGGLINHACVRGQYEYEHVGTVLAHSLEQAFMRAQNDFEPWAEYGVRSTCVGDIITHPSKEVGAFPVCHMIKGVGFTEVPHTVVSYIDWGNHMEPEPKLYCDDCTVEVDATCGDPRHEIRYYHMDEHGNETVESRWVCEYCYQQEYSEPIDYSMTKTEFYQKYGGLLVEVATEDLEYGNHLILYPEEVEKAQQLQREGKDIYTLYEEPSEEEEETVKKGLDSGTYVVGYYAVNNPE